MKIVIETIKHEDQRYPTCGDWFKDEDGVLHITVSELGNWREELLVAVHELAEWAQCTHAGIDQAVVDHFDVTFEENRKSQLIDPTIAPEKKALIKIEEPGDHAGAPYRVEHCIATGIERVLAGVLGVVWADYEKKLEALP